MEKQEIIKILKDVLGEPDCYESLEAYINHCRVNMTDSADDYCEYHHILPRSVFPEYVRITENIVRLSYEDHVEAHFLLAEAYPIKKLTRTLNFMKNRTDEQCRRLRILISEATKKQWKNMTEEEYDARCLMYSDRMKLMMASGSEYHKKVCDGVRSWWDNHPECRSEKSKFFKDLWKNKTKEELNQWKTNMKWTDDNRELHIAIMNDRYANTEWKAVFVEKMTEINRSESKRKLASQTLKDKWLNDSEYRNKLYNRPKRSTEKNKEHSEKMKARWSDPEYKRRILEKRRKSKNETD